MLQTFIGNVLDNSNSNLIRTSSTVLSDANSETKESDNNLVRTRRHIRFKMYNLLF